MKVKSSSSCKLQSRWCVRLGSAANLLYCYWWYLLGRLKRHGAGRLVVTDKIACWAALAGSRCFGGRSGSFHFALAFAPARLLGRLCCGSDKNVASDFGIVADDDQVGRQGEHEFGEGRRRYGCSVKRSGDYLWLRRKMSNHSSLQSSVVKSLQCRHCVPTKFVSKLFQDNFVVSKLFLSLFLTVLLFCCRVYNGCCCSDDAVTSKTDRVLNLYSCSCYSCCLALLFSILKTIMSTTVVVPCMVIKTSLLYQERSHRFGIVLLRIGYCSYFKIVLHALSLPEQLYWIVPLIKCSCSCFWPSTCTVYIFLSWEILYIKPSLYAFSIFDRASLIDNSASASVYSSGG